MRKSFLLLALLCSACSLAPTYHRPEVALPARFGEGIFAIAKPADELPKGAWWKTYGDPDLDFLESGLSANQSLQAAISRLSEAQSALAAQRATLFPSVGVNASSQKINNSANRAFYFKGMPLRYSDNLLTADVSYEADVFGRLSNLVASSRAQAEASRSDLASLRLSLEAELAADYFSLQALRAERNFQKQLVEKEGESLQFTKVLFQGGAAPEADVDQAEISLQSARQQEQDLGIQEAALVHAIAVLLGKPASGFVVRTRDAMPEPQFFAAIPSTLLERRPDIASAERQVEAANFQIGVAKAAFFPQFNFSAAGGYESGQMGNLITAPSELWALGAAAAVTVFDAGLRSSLEEQAKARYRETVANYRQTVLNAFREVEDGLSSLHQLEQENAAQKNAVISAQKALEQAQFRYSEGMSPIQDLVSAQIQLLQNRSRLSVLQGTRMNASVLLVKALGGGPP
ncbi:MAG: efflux transporter outer membrane subunit [Burkholderiales bacterium]|nr:efflux transporter outer membrane subunit [Burkholderiales bacterium]